MRTQENFKCNKCTKDKCTFVNNKTAKENRQGIFEILLKANKLMKAKGYPGACFSLVGSSKRSMIYIKNENTLTYDHDIQNLYYNQKNTIQKYTKTLRNDFISCLKEVFPNKNLYIWKTENSTKVITIKKLDFSSNLLASFDVALLDAFNNKIHIFEKKNNESIWNELGNINESYLYAKKLNMSKLKQEYLNLKHNQKWMAKTDENYKHSFELFIEAVRNIKYQNHK